LSKSSWSRRSILSSPFLFIGNIGNAETLFAVSLTAVEQPLGSRLRGANNAGFSHQFKKITHQSEWAARSRGLSSGRRRPDLMRQRPGRAA
jgi:hypothetical protein